MEDNSTDVLLFAILLLFFALLLSRFDDNISYEPAPIVEQDNMFNKWKRIY
jgi:hypothetical protein